MAVRKIFKKNQIMITVLAIMLAVAGYLNFAGKGVGEEELAVDQNTVFDEDGIALLDITEEDIESLDSDYVELPNEESYAEADLNAFVSETVDSDYVESQLLTEETEQMAQTDQATVEEVPGEAVFTSATTVGSLSGAKFMKEQTRSKNKETLLEIINNTTLSEDQKKDAINQMIALTGVAEQETSAEILLEARGFTDVVVSIGNGTADVMVGMSELSEAECAQIIDIVQRKTALSPENIIITPIGAQETE